MYRTRALSSLKTWFSDFQSETIGSMPPPNEVFSSRLSFSITISDLSENIAVNTCVLPLFY